MPMDKPVVLVVDDAAGIREMVSQILYDEGYVIETAADGVEALAVVERVRPNLVLLDMRMPNMNGWEFARVLNERGIGLPIIVITAAQSAKSWASEIGAAGFLAKPFGVQSLIDKVQQLCPLPVDDIARGGEARQARPEAS
jgi:CheY-like chemotaxis protein